MKRTIQLLAALFVFAGSSVCQAKIYQDFEVGNGSDEYAWPINSASILLVGGSEPHFGGRALRIGGPGFAGAGIQSQIERWNYNMEPEVNDRLSFWVHGGPLDNSDNTVSVRFFDQGNYHAGGFEVWTTQTFRHGQWTQLKVLFSQLPADFDLHHVDKIEIVNYAAGVHYIDSIEVNKDDRVYQSFEPSLRAGSTAADFGFKWNDADFVGLSAPGEPVFEGGYSWKLVAAERWSGFGLQSQEKKLVVPDAGAPYQDFWHVDLDPAHNTLLSFWVYGLPLNQMDNNVSIQFYDHHQHFTDETKVVYWTKTAARVGRWSRLVVPFDDLLKQPNAADLRLDDLNKIQIQVYWPGTYYFDEIRASGPIPKIDAAALPLGRIQWEVLPGTDYRLYESEGPDGPWNQIWESFTDPLHNGDVPVTRLTPAWYRVNHSDPAHYEPAVITIDSAALRTGSVDWKTIPQTQTYEVQSAPAKSGPWSHFYLGLPLVQQAHPGDWYRVRAVHVDSADAITEASAWGPAIADSTELGFVRADRTVLREQNGLGQVLLLRGPNLGGLFINEPWMTGIGDFDNPKVADDYSMRQLLESRFGVEAAAQLLETYQESYLQAWDFDAILRTGFNAVRLPVYYRQFQDESGNWILNGQGQIDFSAIDRIVKFCADRGLYVVLDLHAAPGAQNNEIHSGRGGYNKLFENSPLGEGFRDRTVAVWQALAEHFKDEPAIAGYDLLNEPVGYAALPDLWALYDRLYDAIRAVDPEHLIMIEGAFDWNTLPSPASQGWENVLYQFHYYLFGQSEDVAAHQQFVDAQLAQAEGKQLEYQVPVLIGEFNAFSMKPIWEYYLNAFSRQGFGWMPWSYKFHNSPSDWGLFNHAYYKDDEPKLATDSLADLTRKFSSYDTANRHAPNETLTQLLSNAIAQPANQPPLLSRISNKSATEGQSLSFTLRATDPDNDAIVFSALSLPVGASLNGNRFAWTPAFNQSGMYIVTFIASDGGLEDSQAITITVNDAPLQVRSLNSSQSLISPNNDGVQDSATLTGHFNHTVSTGKLVVLNAANQAVRVWVEHDVDRIQQVWDGKDGNSSVVADGAYQYVLLGVDAGDATASRSGSLTVATPDLAVVSVTHSPAMPTAGKTVTISVVVKNVGAAKAAVSSVRIQVGSEPLPSTHSLASLGPNGMKTINRKLPLSAGVYPVTVTVDPANALIEKDESNNTGADSITIH